MFNVFVILTLIESGLILFIIANIISNRTYPFQCAVSVVMDEISQEVDYIHLVTDLRNLAVREFQHSLRRQPQHMQVLYKTNNPRIFAYESAIEYAMRTIDWNNHKLQEQHNQLFRDDMERENLRMKSIINYCISQENKFDYTHTYIHNPIDYK